MNKYSKDHWDGENDSQQDVHWVEQLLRETPQPEVPKSLLPNLLNNLKTRSVDAVECREIEPRSSFQMSQIVGVVVASVILLAVTASLVIYFGKGSNNVAAENDSSFEKSLTPVAHEIDPKNVLPKSKPAAIGLIDQMQQPLETVIDLSAAAKWNKAWMPAPGLTMARGDQFGKPWPLSIENTHEYGFPVANNWSFVVTSFRPNSAVRLSALIRTESAHQANVCVQCWSKSGQLVGFVSTVVVTGSSDWQRCHSELLSIPENTDRVMVRAALTGTGKVWFDDVELVMIDHPGYWHEDQNHISFVALPRQERQQEKVDDKEVAKLIKQLGTAKDAKFEILRALIDVGKPAVDPLRKLMLNRQELFVRRWRAAMILGGIGDKSAVEDLFKTLNEKPASELLQKVVIDALVRFNDKDIKKRLRTWIKKPTTSNSLKEYATARIEGRVPKEFQRQQKKRKPSAWENQFNWASSHQLALESAKANDRLVITFVYAYQSPFVVPHIKMDPAEVPFHLLIRGPFNDPDIKALMKQHFVTRKISTKLEKFDHYYSAPRDDPFKELNTTAHSISPPAILFHDADGKLLKKINAIGTFNSRMYHAALQAVLKETGKKLDPLTLFDIPAKLPKSAHKVWVEAKSKYYAGDFSGAFKQIQSALDNQEFESASKFFAALGGKLLHHEGKKKEAAKMLEKAIEAGLTGESLGEAIYWLYDCDLSAEQKRNLDIRASKFKQSHVNSIWRHSLDMRMSRNSIQLSRAESFNHFESLSELFGEKTQHAQLIPAVVRGFQYLASAQTKLGSWEPFNGNEYAINFTGPAVTAICASAIHEWLHSPKSKSFTRQNRQQLEAMEKKARQFLLKYCKRTRDMRRRDYTQVFNQTYALEYFLTILAADRSNKEIRNAAQTMIDALIKHQYKEGGWSYLPPTSSQPWGGIRPHSFNTAPILIELVKAKKMGLKLEQSSIDAAVRSLESVRSKDGAFAYAPPKSFSWLTRQKCAIARDTLCEMALNAAGKKNQKALSAAYDRFYKNRSDLEIVRKLYASAFNPNGHGSYFYAFGYFYASKALPLLSDETSRKTAPMLKKDLLSIVELDGTWIDHHGYGKPYATGMVLRALLNAELHCGD